MLQIVGKAADAADLRTDARHIGHDRHLAAVAGVLDHPLGDFLAGGAIVGREEGLIGALGAVGERAVDDDDGDAALKSALDRRGEGVRIGRGEHDAGHAAIDRVLDQIDLVGDGAFGGRSVEAHRMGRLALDRSLSPLVHILPEVGIRGLHDDGDFTGLSGARAGAGTCERDERCRKTLFHDIHALVSSTFDWLTMDRPSSRTVADLVDPDCADDDEADDDLLNEGGDPRHIEAVAQDADDEGPDHGARDRPHPA